MTTSVITILKKRIIYNIILILIRER